MENPDFLGHVDLNKGEENKGEENNIKLVVADKSPAIRFHKAKQRLQTAHCLLSLKGYGP